MIKVSEVSFSYGKNRLFKNLSLELGAGTITGLLGKNGAGKTTLLRLLCGLLYSDRGGISVAGKDPQKREAELLSGICFIPEEFSLPRLTPGDYENIHAPFYPLFDHDFLAAAADDFQIPRNKNLGALSYGQRKKYLLAFGLATGASVIFLDEPTNGLDIPSKIIFRKLLADAHTKDRLFIISTHQVRDVENLIDNIVILDNGAIIFNRTVEETTEETAGTEKGQDSGGGGKKTADLEKLFLSVLGNRNENI